MFISRKNYTGAEKEQKLKKEVNTTYHLIFNTLVEGNPVLALSHPTVYNTSVIEALES